MSAPTWGEVVSQATPPEETVHICVRGDLVAEKDRLVEELRQAQLRDDTENRPPQAPIIARRIQELEDECTQSTVEFRFRAVPRPVYKRLLAEHKPTAEQQQEAKDNGIQLSYNADTFPPALLAASCVAPTGATVEQMTQIHDTWALGPLARLWRACVAANDGVADPGPKSVSASVVLRNSETNSTTAPTAESPTASSADA